MKEAGERPALVRGEMERRYKLMSAVGVRNLAGFNKKVKDAQDAGPFARPLFEMNSTSARRPADLNSNRCRTSS